MAMTFNEEMRWQAEEAIRKAQVEPLKPSEAHLLAFLAGITYTEPKRTEHGNEVEF